MHESVRERSSGLLLQILAGEWELVPEVRSSRVGGPPLQWCDICNSWSGGDLQHVLLHCRHAELVRVRQAWVAEVESALVNAGQGAWWAGLPLTLEGRGAVMMGHISAAPQDQTEAWRDLLTSVFLKHIGSWWNSLGDEAIALLTGV